MPGLEKNLERFKGLDAQVVGISIDSKFANKAWADSIGGISYPLLCDFWPHGEVARAYGVLDEAGGRAERAVFIIDKAGKVRYIDVHDIGEQPDEAQILEELAKL
jgi:alkyl hydroperoxide reductase subunit AhpC